MKNPKSHFPPPNEAYCREKPMLESSNHWALPMLANTKKDSNHPQNLQSWKLSPCHSLSQPLKLSLLIIFPNADLLINRYADHFSSLQPGNLLMNCCLHQLSGSMLLDSDCSVELGDSSTSSSEFPSCLSVIISKPLANATYFVSIKLFIVVTISKPLAQAVYF
ncbi:hypothetical protein O6H91_11G068000 [Diphasiastrum complanatum]|uniref:Uncharacterized protein n=1 Tax=Diphasiastrum complanatum TaxID=34168 RepID=A0ACC2CA57_DIPCM|nr:hypothetical protein O6H91_11G068000 [Diphasiastrum complanatum]